MELVLSAVQVDEVWLPELAPHFYTREAPPDKANAARDALLDPSTTMGDVAAGGGAGDGRRAAAGVGAAATGHKRPRAPEHGSGREQPQPPAGPGGGGGVAAMLGASQGLWFNVDPPTAQ